MTRLVDRRYCIYPNMIARHPKLSSIARAHHITRLSNPTRTTPPGRLQANFLAEQFGTRGCGAARRNSNGKKMERNESRAGVPPGARNTAAVRPAVSPLSVILPDHTAVDIRLPLPTTA